MAGKPLRSQLNQIRAWVREGRTDAWIAHQLDISASELREFRRRHDLNPDSEPDTTDDLRDEIEAEVEAATLAAAEARPEEDPDDDLDDRESSAERSSDGGADDDDDGDRPRRRRRRRGGRGRTKRAATIEASFDHGQQDGYGLWFDASIKDNPVYTEHWAGNRAVQVTVEADQIVIRRADPGTN
ncbi:MAG: hypothetical protein H0V25_07635 [Solirubrobacterales bacterium]|nr:hypothetical protein [Solirubrobacterales bacterium]